ncbi:NepR family anti-sigma factor [Siccirubricoccus deserti]
MTAYPSLAAGAMSKADQTGSGEVARPDAGRKEEGVDHAFDLWLQRGLHQLYDTVAKEPIPEDLLRLIEDDLNSRKK